jgi:predicted nucleic acid-binding protein
MPVFYLDTSAVLKRYRTESGTDVVDSLYEERFTPTVVKLVLSGYRRDVLITSHFTCLEVESVAARMFRGKLLDEKAYNTLLNAFARDIENT